MLEPYAVVLIPTPDGQPGRLILAEPSVMGLGRFNRLLDQAQKAADEHYGPLPEDAEQNTSERVNAGAFITRWVEMMTCFVRYETENGDGTFHETPFPYADPIVFVEELRYSLQRDIFEAAGRLVGPLLGRTTIAEADQKKEPSATTTWLTVLPKA
jgi:hypothetical protein